jgi:hypothetical protein
MTKPIVRDRIYRKRAFGADIITVSSLSLFIWVAVVEEEA